MDRWMDGWMHAHMDKWMSGNLSLAKTSHHPNCVRGCGCPCLALLITVQTYRTNSLICFAFLDCPWLQHRGSSVQWCWSMPPSPPLDFKLELGLFCRFEKRQFFFCVLVVQTQPFREKPRDSLLVAHSGQQCCSLV